MEFVDFQVFFYVRITAPRIINQFGRKIYQKKREDVGSRMKKNQFYFTLMDLKGFHMISFLHSVMFLSWSFLFTLTRFRSCWLKSWKSALLKIVGFEVAIALIKCWWRHQNQGKGITKSIKMPKISKHFWDYWNHLQDESFVQNIHRYRKSQ